MPERPAVAATRPQRAATGGSPRHPGLALLVIATAQLMVVLDRSIRFQRESALPHGGGDGRALVPGWRPRAGVSGPVGGCPVSVVARSVTNALICREMFDPA